MRTDLIRNRPYSRAVVNDPELLIRLTEQHRDDLVRAARLSRQSPAAAAVRALMRRVRYRRAAVPSRMPEGARLHR